MQQKVHGGWQFGLISKIYPKLERSLWQITHLHFMANYDDFISSDNQFEENKRPGFLTALCILTFISSGFSLISQLLMPVTAHIALEFIQQSSFASIPGMIETYEQIIETPIWQFYMTAFFCATSLLGAIYMLKMKKIGFHIYTVSKFALLLITQFLMGDYLAPKFSGLFITLLFIGLYAIYYKKFSAMEQEISDFEN